MLGSVEHCLSQCPLSSVTGSVKALLHLLDIHELCTGLKNEMPATVQYFGLERVDC